MKHQMFTKQATYKEDRTLTETKHVISKLFWVTTAG